MRHSRGCRARARFTWPARREPVVATEQQRPPGGPRARPRGGARTLGIIPNSNPAIPRRRATTARPRQVGGERESRQHTVRGKWQPVAANGTPTPARRRRHVRPSGQAKVGRPRLAEASPGSRPGTPARHRLLAALDPPKAFSYFLSTIPTARSSIFT